jgi:hypothetical protein
MTPPRDPDTGRYLPADSNAAFRADLDYMKAMAGTILEANAPAEMVRYWLADLRRIR